MYNHYIPQSDGSFRRSSMPDPNRRPNPAKPPAPPPPPLSPPKPEPECKPIQPNPPAPAPCTAVQENPLGFLRKLLPKDLDISDLVIIGLLLLLSAEECEDDLSPLLTIALYFLL